MHEDSYLDQSYEERTELPECDDPTLDCDEHYEEDYEPCEPDNWADGDALASAGWGTNEDYGCFDDGFYEDF